MRMPLHAGHRNLPGMFSGRRSRVYDFAARRLLRPFYRRIADDIAATAPDSGAVLDAGTGPGVLLVELAKRRPDLTLAGIDLSADMVAAAGRNLGDRVTVRVADVTELPFPDDSFDLVVSSLSVHHWDRPAAAVPELARVLRPGGRFVVYDFRFAPFDELAAAARAGSVFTGSPKRSLIRTGVLLHPRCVRYEMSTVDGPARG